MDREQERTAITESTQALLVPLFCADDIKHYVENYVKDLLPFEKEYYTEEQILPFRQYAERISIKMHDYFSELKKEFETAKKTLKEYFQFDRGQNWEEDSTIEALENALQETRSKLSDPAFLAAQKKDERALYVKLGIPKLFLKRSYQVAKTLLDNKKYDQAQSIFQLLRTLNPNVFAYWIGEASCHHAQGEFKQAKQQYSTCLMFKPENPALYFEIAKCNLLLHEKEACLQALEKCVELAQKSEEMSTLLKEAEQMHLEIQLKRAS